jgi:hypothetical protein
MNADTELDAAFRRQAGVALDDAALYLDGTAWRGLSGPANPSGGP